MALAVFRARLSAAGQPRHPAAASRLRALQPRTGSSGRRGWKLFLVYSSFHGLRFLVDHENLLKLTLGTKTTWLGVVI